MIVSYLHLFIESFKSDRHYNCNKTFDIFVILVIIVVVLLVVVSVHEGLQLCTLVELKIPRVDRVSCRRHILD